jgi:hypothetical protein
MKRIIALSAPTALAFVLAAGLGTAAHAKNGANNGAKDAVAWCQANAADYGLSMGDCVSLLRTKDPVQTCKDLADFGGLEYFGYTSFSDCVSSNRHS